MRIDVLTLFPEMFQSVLEHGLLRIAQEKSLVHVRLTNIRDFASDKRGTVDERPYGGGPGMLLLCDPVFRAVEAVESANSAAEQRGQVLFGGGVPFESSEFGQPRRLLLSPQGRRLCPDLIQELAEESWLILICGHYEGLDERIRQGLEPEEVSVGDYVLSGGELPAMVLMDALVRFRPGVLGDPESAYEDSFSNDFQGLEYPQFTRPRDYRGMSVPNILLSGNHAAIASWRREQGLKKTALRRPDLLVAKQQSSDNGMLSDGPSGEINNGIDGAN